MNERSAKPSWIRPFDNQPLSEETSRRQTAAREFNQLFDELAPDSLANLGRQAADDDRQRAVNYLDLVVRVDGRRYLMTLEEGPTSEFLWLRHSEDYSRAVCLTDIDGNCWGYYLCRDDVVRRVDTTAVEVELEGRAELASGGRGLGEAAQPGWDWLEARQRETQARLEAQRLAEDAGLNNQPVTPGEMIELRAVLARADFESGPTWTAG